MKDMGEGYYQIFECVEAKDGKSPMAFIIKGTTSTRKAACYIADTIRNRARTAAESIPKAAIYAGNRLIQPVG